MKLIEDLKKDINNSFKEVQENISQEVEALKKETKKKSLKELQENTNKQVKALNKPSRNLKQNRNN